MLPASLRIIRSRLSLMAHRAVFFLSRQAFNMGVAIIGLAFVFGFFWAIGHRDACVDAVSEIFRFEKIKERHSHEDLTTSATILFGMGAVMSVMFFSIFHSWLMRISARMKARASLLAESQQPELAELRAQQESVALNRAAKRSAGERKTPAPRI